jgi:NAD(P)-dependent dehydrogenase (short-subunit alcohol dehydrogenase family)
MTVVVTGAAGFIGSHLVEALAARGERVVAIDRRPDMPAAAGVRIVADLVDAAAGVVDDMLWEADAVFHLAARAGVRIPRDQSHDLQDDHHGGSVKQPHDTTSPDRLRHRDNVLAAERVLQRVPNDVPVGGDLLVRGLRRQPPWASLPRARPAAPPRRLRPLQGRT